MMLGRKTVEIIVVLLVLLSCVCNASAKLRGQQPRNLKKNCEEDDKDAEDCIEQEDTSKETLGKIYDDLLEDADAVLDVVIVGGGWSGVAALDHLATENPDQKVVLLEAYESLGGRSRTIYDFVPNVTTELGSAWLYEDTIVEELANEANIPYGRIDYFNDWEYLGLYDEMLGDSTGSSLSLEEKQLLLSNEWEDSFVSFSKKQAQKAEYNVPYQTVLDEYFASNDESQQFINAMVHTQLELEYAAPLDQVAAQEVGGQANDCIFCSGAYLYTAVPYSSGEKGGFGRLINDLAEPYKHQIRLNSRVTKIDYSYNLTMQTSVSRQDDDQKRPVLITYQDDSGTRTVLAKRVLMTASLGVLKSGDIDFVPPLPDRKQRAMDNFGMGILNKCIFYWDDEADTGNGTAATSDILSWWPRGQAALTLIRESSSEDAPGPWITFFNDRNVAPHHGNRPFILSSWIGGKSAQWAEENQSDEDIVETVLGNLRTMLGDKVPEPTKYLITRWGQDDLSYGSYSFVKAAKGTSSRIFGGGSVEARDELATPIDNKVFFAGEATDENYGTTFGAYASGKRAAEEIVKAAKDDS